MIEHRPKWSHSREREICACGNELPCREAALLGVTMLLPVQTLAGHDSAAPLLSPAFMRLIERGILAPTRRPARPASP